jgi:2-dehydropantoate 2-reductase
VSLIWQRHGSNDDNYKIINLTWERSRSFMENIDQIQNIAIYGLGGVGGFFGSQLAAAAEQGKLPGLAVTFIMRGAHLAAVQSAGLTVLQEGREPCTVHPAFAAASLQDTPQPDVIFICVKGYHLPAALEEIKPFVRPETVVIPLLNGFDIYHRVRAALPAAIVLPSCCYIVAKIERPGVIWQNGGIDRIISGPDPARPDYDGAALRSVLERAGLDLDWNEDPWPKIWRKYLYIAGINLVNTEYKFIDNRATAPEALRLRYRLVLNEMVDIARHMGAVLPDDLAEDVARRCLEYPDQQTSSFQRDLMETGKSTEADLFGSALIDKGRELKVPVPVITEIVGRLAAQFPAVAR